MKLRAESGFVVGRLRTGAVGRTGCGGVGSDGGGGGRSGDLGGGDAPGFAGLPPALATTPAKRARRIDCGVVETELGSD